MWAIALIVIVKTLVLVRVHRRMALSDKLSVAIPGLCFGLIYLVLFLFPSSQDVQRFFVRNGLATLFTWYMVMLLRTRKQHINV
jgi:hypothetical protein